MNMDWVRELNQAVDVLASDPDVRVLVIRGEGPAFCSGLDLDMMGEQGMPPDFFSLQEQAFTALEQMRAIVIAQVHGYCLGGGLQLALACDIRIASENAMLGLPAALEGLPPGVAPWRLPRFVGLGRALRLALSGEHVDAAEARGIGLVDYVLPVEGFADAGRSIAARYAEVPRGGLGHQGDGSLSVRRRFRCGVPISRTVIAQCLDGPDVAAAQEAWAARRSRKSAG